MKRLILVLLFFFSAGTSIAAMAPNKMPSIESLQDLNIHIVFGYKDARPARFVGDRYERLSVLQQLLKPCSSPENQSCGFSRDTEDSTLLEKEISRAPEPPYRIHIRITSSSAGADDDDNRKNPYQNQLSLISENNFFYGLNDAQAVFYIGHSRDGGGPDFQPPLLRKNNHVDYSWYKKHRPGFQRLLTLLQVTSASTLELGLYSCASTQLFETQIRRSAKRVHLVTEPELLYYSQALDKALKELSRFINKRLSRLKRPPPFKSTAVSHEIAMTH